MLEPVGPHKDVNPLVTVFFEQVITSHNQLEHSQLEDPPDIDLQAEQTVAHDGDDKSNGRHDKRCDGVGIVALRHLRSVAVDRSPLPEAERDQKRREDQRDQAVRYEYDPERDDHQSHQHYRGVDPHSVVELLAVMTDQKRGQHGDQQQRELDQKPRSHREEMRCQGDILRDSDDNHKQNGGSKHEYGSLPLAEPLSPEVFDAPHQHLDNQHAEQRGYRKVDQHHERESDDHRSPPLALHIREISPAVFVIEILRGPRRIRPDMSQYFPEIILSLNEYLLLDHLVAFLSIVVGLFKPLVCGLIIFIVLDHVVTDVREHLQQPC